LFIEAPGHSVKATIAGEAVPGQISSLYPSIRPAVERAGSDETAVTKANAGKIISLVL
jgi:hypothetical protein